MLGAGRVAVGVLWAESELDAGGRRGGGGGGVGGGGRFVVPDLGDGGEAAKGMGGASGRGWVPRVVHGKGLGLRECAADGAVLDGGRRLRRLFRRRRRRHGDGRGHLLVLGWQFCNLKKRSSSKCSRSPSSLSWMPPYR